MTSRNANFSRLVDEELEQILSRLPAATILDCRLVCKRFNLVSTKVMLDIAAVTPWLLTFSSGSSIAGYSPNTGRWRRLALPAEFNLYRGDPLVSSGGLLTIRRNDNLVVCNPVTGNVRDIPSVRDFRHIQMIGMANFGEFYWILAMVQVESAPGGMPETVTQMFDSGVGWTLHSRSHIAIYYGSQYDYRAVWFHGSFYFLATVNDAIILMRYNMELRAWVNEEMRLTVVRNFKSRSLAVCEGRLLLVGISGRDLCACTRMVEVWEADWIRLEWMAIGTMPSELFRKARAESMEVVRCVGQGHLLWFSIRKERRGPPWLESILFDLRDRTWQWLPGDADWGRYHGRTFGRNDAVALLLEPEFASYQ